MEQMVVEQVVVEQVVVEQVGLVLEGIAVSLASLVKMESATINVIVAVIANMKRIRRIA